MLALPAASSKLGYLGLQQPVPVLREHRRIPNLVVQVQSHEPAEQNAVIDLLHQQPLAADRVQHLQNPRSQQLLRRNRRPAFAGLHAVELRGKSAQNFVHHRPDCTQWMILSHPRLGRQITEDVTLLVICASHAFS